MPDVVIFADSIRSPELRHEVPVSIGDPFLYVERDGRRHAVIGSMEIPRIEAAGTDIQCHPLEEFGSDELIAQGLATEELRKQVYLRALRALGVEQATVPFWFPLAFADHLRAEGLELTADRELFAARRRVKSESELAGIRRAQRAAEAGMDAARELLRSDEAARGELTVERVKHAIAGVFLAHGTAYDEFIVSHGWQSAIGHHMGEGTIAPGEPVVIDLWPRDEASACYADMTRTFVVGEPPEELVRLHALVRESLDRSLEAIRPGVGGRAVYDASCEPFEREGFPTQRTKTPGQPLEEGFFHGLGHGVGLEVHEEPGMGISSQAELLAGDVVTVEPGLYRTGWGGCRLEDLVVVTEDGYESLTEYPYDLAP